MQSGLASIKFAATALALSGLLAFPSQAGAADVSMSFTGNLFGSVVDDLGSPQMGATVQLLNRYERVLAKAITSSDGKFLFAALPLDVYAVRVSQPSYLPAFRDRIFVKAGSDSFLQIHLATLFSNIQVSYKLPSGAMSNDWKWVLRTSAATRPVMRYLPDELPQDAKAKKSRVFSDTHALLSLNGGDSGAIDSDRAPSDFGSSFAVSTNLFGKNQVQIAGSYAQNADLAPSIKGLAAVYQRDPESPFIGGPEVTMTFSQFNRFGTQFAGSSQMPSLTVMSVGLYESADPLENVHLEYGMTSESVDYLQHSARISPFGRITVALNPKSEVVAAYSDGGRPDLLMSHSAREGENVELSNAVNALGRLPQISSRDGVLKLQRTQSYELGLGRVSGSRRYSLSGFYENVWNGRLNMSGNLAPLDAGDILLDGVSKTATYDVGNYRRTGYVGAVTQRVNEYVDLGVSYGRMGGFTADAGKLFAGSGTFLKMGMHDVANASLKASVPSFGTRISAGYGWVDAGSVVPAHFFTTQAIGGSPGLNFALRQPIPSLFGLPGRLEVTADMRNLLAQGYIPVAGGGNGQLLVVQSPRAIRGGLNLTF